MKEETQLALAKLFVETWEMFVDGATEDTQYLMENSVLAKEVIATQEDVDNSVAPEGCEEGDSFYVLSELGHEAWEYAKGEYR